MGILSLLPPIVTIVLAVITKDTIISLLIGALLGATILSGWNPLVGTVKLFQDYIVPSIGNNTGLFLFVALIGGFMGVLRISGSLKGLEKFSENHIHSRKSALTLTWASCFAFLFTEPPVIVGYIMRPITDRFRVSRVKLAYVTDAMGAPLASVSPLAPHTSFIASLIATQIAALGIAGTGWGIYIKAMPFVAYSWISIILAFLVVRVGLDYGPMYAAEKRAVETGETLGENDVPMVSESGDYGISDDIKGRPYFFFVPLLVLFVTILVYIFWSGKIFSNGFIGAFAKSDVVLAITLGVTAATLTSAIIGGANKNAGYKDIVGAWVKGISGQVLILIILVLAWSIGSIIVKLGIQSYISGIVSGSAIVKMVPALAFLAGCIVSFASGSSWGVFSIMIPIVVPIANATGISLPLCIGAAVSGGLFGDHCSPISDTTIMSSSGAASDHIEHVKTQLPYALTIAVSLLVGYIAAGITGIDWLSLIIGLAGTIVIYLVCGNYYRRKGGVSA